MRDLIINYATSAIIATLASWLFVRWHSSEGKVIATAKSVDQWILEKTGIHTGLEAKALGVVAWVDATWGDQRSVRQLLRTILTIAKDPAKTAELMAEAKALVAKYGEDWVSGLMTATPDLQAANNAAKQALGSRVLAAKAPETPVAEVHAAIQAAAPATIADRPSVPIRSSEMQSLIEQVRAKVAGK